MCSCGHNGGVAALPTGEDVSVSLQRLQGRISDVEYDRKADLEQRILLQRHLLKRLTGSPTGLSKAPHSGESPDP